MDSGELAAYLSDVIFAKGKTSLTKMSERFFKFWGLGTKFL